MEKVLKIIKSLFENDFEKYIKDVMQKGDSTKKDDYDIYYCIYPNETNGETDSTLLKFGITVRAKSNPQKIFSFFVECQSCLLDDIAESASRFVFKTSNDIELRCDDNDLFMKDL